MTPWPFIHPVLAAAAAGLVLLPVVIHLLNRRRYRRVRWAAMRFLQSATQRSARRMLIEHWLLLTLRMLILLLIGLALARPFIPAGAGVVFGASRAHHILLLDNSRSMNARNERGQTAWADVKTAATRRVEQLPASDAVSVVTLAAPADVVIGHAAFDRRFIQDRLATCLPTQRATDVLGALEHARRIAGEARVAAGNVHVEVFSDLAGPAWATGDSPEGTPVWNLVLRLAALGNVSIVRPRADTDNAAVAHLATEDTLVAANHATRIVAGVVNDSGRTLRGASLQLEQESRIIARLPVPPVAPGDTVSLSAPTLFPSPGVHTVKASLIASEKDALPDDDVRYLSVEVRRNLPALLVDGRPSASPLRGQAGYLATALAPRLRASDVTVVAPRVITELELSGEALVDSDLVALCNVQRLPPETWKRLEAFVDNGGSLLVFLGDLVSRDHYNQFGFADDAGLLPARLGTVVGGDDAAGETTISTDLPSQPIVAPFAGLHDSGLFLARIQRYIRVEPSPRRAEVVLRYASGDPMLVLARYGSGAVALITTSPDMTWTNLPAKGDYVSLMNRIVAHLAPSHTETYNRTVGDELRHVLTAREAALQPLIHDPAGRTTNARLKPEGNVLNAVSPLTETPGVWSFVIADQSLRYSVNVDPAESDLRGASAAEIERRTAGTVRLIEYDGERERDVPLTPRASELASWALVAVMLLLLAEAVLAMRIGSAQQSD
jgi:hypothetical protein